MPDDLLDEVKGQLEVGLFERDEADDADIDVGGRHEARSADVKLVVHVALALRHDGQTAALAVARWRHQPLGDLALEGERERDAAVAPRAAPLRDGAQPADDERRGHVERKVADNVDGRSVVRPRTTELVGEEGRHVEPKDVPLEDAHPASTGVVQQLRRANTTTRGDDVDTAMTTPPRRLVQDDKVCTAKTNMQRDGPSQLLHNSIHK